MLLRQDRDSVCALGLMSGTSMDGLDIALVQITEQAQPQGYSLLAFASRPFPTQVRRAIERAVSDPHQGIASAARLNFFLGHLFADYALAFLQEQRVQTHEVDLIGSHGQTICHLPDKVANDPLSVPATFQIADPAILAVRTGIVTVGDFRIADMANGGQGAPLVPFFDFHFMRNPQKSQLFLNVGGVANLSALAANCREGEIIAFDTGPGNALLDAFSSDFYGTPFDDGGLRASTGSCRDDLLQRLLAYGFFARKPPKSADRNRLTVALKEMMLNAARTDELSEEDLLATATELTVQSIYQASQKFLGKTSQWDELIISGGGARNGHLLDRLQAAFDPIPVVKSDDRGLPAEAKEAVCFALMGYYTMKGLANNVPAATRAKDHAVLGKICLPNPRSGTTGSEI